MKPDVRFNQILIGAITDNGYAIFNPLAKKGESVAQDTDKNSALAKLNNIGFGAGRLFVANGDNLDKITTQHTVDERVDQLEQVMNSPAFVGSTLAISVLSVGAGGIALEGSSVALRTLAVGLKVASFASSGTRIAYGALAGADLAISFQQGNASFENTVSDLSVLALTMLPVKGSGVADKLLGLRIGGAAFLNTEAIINISNIANDPNIPGNEKFLKISTAITMQAFFNMALNSSLKQNGQTQELAKNQLVKAELGKHKVSPEQVMTMKPEDIRAI